MSASRVSICIPNLDMERYVGEAIESALAQTHPDVEVVVVDNHSSDGSWRLIRALAAREPRLRVSRNRSTVGMPANWNRCLTRASGRYAVVLSADDRLHPDFAARCAALLDRHSSVGYVFTARTDLDEGGREATRPAFYRSSAVIPGRAEGLLNLVSNHNAPSQTLFDLHRLRAIGGFDERFDWAHDIHAKLLLNFAHDVGYIDAPLCAYRVHAASSTARIHRSKLGVMEIYRVKLDVLDRIAKSPAERERLVEGVAQHAARLCRDQAERCEASGDTRLAGEYRHLAAGFGSPVRGAPLSGRRASPPFPLPDGATPLEACA